MRVLFDVNHPAHVHYLRPVRAALVERGHECRVAARDKDVTLALLDHYGIPYSVPAVMRRGSLGRVRELLSRELGLLRLARAFRPQLVMGISLHAARVARLVGARSIVMSEDDLGVVPLYGRIAYPLATLVVTPDCLAHERHGARHRTYPAYQKLLALHPNRFEPDPSVWRELGLDPGSPFGLVRLSALDAYHDVGVRGLSRAVLHRVYDVAGGRMRVFVSAEGELPSDLSERALRLPPERIHHALALATFFLGDSQSMTVEAAVLGTPAFQLSSLYGRLSVPVDLARFGLCFGFQPGEEERLLSELETVLARPDRAEEFRKRREQMLAEKIDPLPWFLKTIEDVVGAPV